VHHPRTQRVFLASLKNFRLTVYELEYKKTEILSQLYRDIGEFLHLDRSNDYILCVCDGHQVLEILHKKNDSLQDVVSQIEGHRNRDLGIWAFEVPGFWVHWDYNKECLIGKKLVSYSILRKVKSINNFFEQQVPTGLLVCDLVDFRESLLGVYKEVYRKLGKSGFLGTSILAEFGKYSGENGK
jgi:hypothetical protein